jgi:hypothetical protein
LSCQFDRHAIDPVECFAARQAIERLADSTPDEAFEGGEIARRDDGLDHLASVGVPGSIHRDETGNFEFGRLVAQHDAARRGESLVIDFGHNNVLVSGHRPKRTYRTLLAVMFRRIAPQATEVRLPDVLLIQLGIADVDLIEWNFFGKRCVIDFSLSVHGAPPVRQAALFDVPRPTVSSNGWGSRAVVAPFAGGCKDSAAPVPQGTAPIPGRR